MGRPFGGRVHAAGGEGGGVALVPPAVRPRALIALTLGAQAYAQLDQQRDEHWTIEAAAALEIPRDDVVTKRLSAEDRPELLELLSTALWKKRLLTEHSVHARAEGARGKERAVRVSGTADAVDAALGAVAEIGPVSVMHIPVDDEQQARHDLGRSRLCEIACISRAELARRHHGLPKRC